MVVLDRDVLAASVIITVDDNKRKLKDSLYDIVKSRKTGYGWNDEIDMGPVITNESKKESKNLYNWNQ